MNRRKAWSKDEKLQKCTGPDNGEVQLFDNLELLTIDDVAALLGKKPQTIRNLVARRGIPFIPGRPVRFLKSSIAAWLAKREVQPCL
jgi:excisionase family DNA binding protein